MPNSDTRKRHALLMGIDKYPHLGFRAQLDGCVNDIRLMQKVLTDQFGFSETDITVITDEQATREGILAALQSLSSKVGKDDIVVVHYAGHGSQITDVEGDEPDGKDSTVVPHDAVRLDPNSEANPPNVDVTDDEIHEWLQTVVAKTPYVTLIFDCCHSGTISRDAFGPKTRYVEPDLRPPEKLGRKKAASTTRSTAAPPGPSGWLPLGNNYVLIAGCRDDEESSEYHDADSEQMHGALTYFLTRELISAEPGTTYQDVFERAAVKVTLNSAAQHPQMEGARDREIFGIRDIQPMRFLAVSERSGNTVTIAGGSVHGLTVGADWLVFPSGTKTDDPELAVGTVNITSVGATASQGEVKDEKTDGVIQAGFRAVAPAGGYGVKPLRVLLSAAEEFPTQASALRQQLEDSPLLEVVNEGEAFDACTFVIPPRTDDGVEKTPVPQVRALGEASWVVTGSDKRLFMPIHGIAEPGVEKLLRDNFEKIARYRRALELSSDASSPLHGKIDVEMLRKDPSGNWVVAKPDASSSEIVYEEGDHVAVRVTNKGDQPAFIYLLDFGLTYGISPMYPPAGAHEPLSAKKSIDLLRDRNIKLRFPRDKATKKLLFPFVVDPTDRSAPEGTEIAKVFATTSPADFGVLSQTTVRGGHDVKPNALGALLATALSGPATRDMSADDEEEQDVGGWTAVSKRFLLRARSPGSTLQDDGTEITLDDVTIRSSGIAGEASLLPSFSGRTRSVEDTADPFEKVLADEHVFGSKTIVISNARRTRSATAAEGEPELAVDVPEPQSGAGQFVMYTDESGVVSWHFAEPHATTRSAGPKEVRTYAIRRHAEPTAPPEKKRGLISSVGQKLIKVLVFPLIDPIIGEVGDYFAGKWEAKKRPYRLRTFTPENHGLENGEPIGVAEWERLAAGKSLLMVHGTFSRAHSAFGSLPDGVVARLHQRYDGRVFAFDHFTLSHDPKQNVEWFLQQVPDGVSLDLDVVCHSRGGLVSRVLSEKQQEFSLGSRALTVGKVIFVASPNAGTHLADADHMGELIDSYTNLLNFVPDNPVTDVLDSVITVAKQLSVSALRGLDGLRSMAPDGDFQKWINAASGSPNGTAYYALAAQFEPTHGGLAAFAKNLIRHAIFPGNNDMVVPTEGVFERNGSPLFPIAERRVFGPEAGIAHSSFFSAKEAQDQILAWLS